MVQSSLTRNGVLMVRAAAGGLCLAFLLGCQPPPPVVQPASPTTTATPAASQPTNPEVAPTTRSSEPTIGDVAAAKANDEQLPAELVEKVEQLIKLTTEYNARAEKITDRQTYLDESGSLAELDNELSDYVQYVESAEPKLTLAQRATLDSKYFSRAKPLIEAKRKHKMRLVSLIQ